jgi:thiol-disulfide isomerase/thioredoxin
MKFVLSISLFFLFVWGAQAQKVANYEIKGTIKGLKNVDVYLAHYFGSTQQVVKDTARVNELGQFTFKGKEDLAKGLYLVSFSGTKYLDLIIGSDHVSFETDTLDVVGKMKVVGSEENAAFYSFQQEMNKQYRSMQSITDQRLADEKRKQIVSYQKEWMLKNQSLFVSKLIKATFEPEIPPYKLPVKNAADSAALYKFQFTFYKKHYFDNMDLNDDRFIRSPFLQRKLEKYFEDLVVQESDSISKDADALLAKIKQVDVRKYVIYKIASTYENHNIVGTDGAFVHLAEKYYIGEPKLWDTTTIRKMKERLLVIKPLIIGKRIPEMVLSDPAGKRLLLSTVPKDYTVVFIYDPECSHCKEETPKLLQQESFFKEKNIGVFAASIVRDKALWQKFIEEFKIQSWYNGIDVHLNPKSGVEEYYTDFKNTFDVYATPVIYVLDKSKRIIGKRIPADKIQDFINFYERKK